MSATTEPTPPAGVVGDLAGLLDRDAIASLIARYAHAVDERDLDAVVACFTDDGRIDFEGGAESARGSDGIREAFADALGRPVMGRPGRSTHLMANTEIVLEGVRACAVTHGVAYLASEERPTVLIRGLVYRDALRREGDRWRIAHRIHRSLWQAEAPGGFTPTAPP